MEKCIDKTELLTVVMPVRNRKRLLAETLRSISDQEELPHGVVKFIAVDNGSTDGAKEMLEAWMSEGAPRWLDAELLTEPRRGACMARNRGLDAAKGEWVMFFDSDDIMKPCHLASVAAAIERQGREADVICWDVDYIGRNGRRGKHRAMVGRDVWRNLIMRGTLSTQRYCCRRDTLIAAGGWDEDIEQWNDWELSVRLAGGGARIAYRAGAPTVTVREHGDSITCECFADGAGKREKAMERVREYATETGLDRVARLTDMKGAVLAGDYAREGEQELSSRLLAELADRSDVARWKLRLIAQVEKFMGRGATVVTTVIEKL